MPEAVPVPGAWAPALLEGSPDCGRDDGEPSVGRWQIARSWWKAPGLGTPWQRCFL